MNIENLSDDLDEFSDQLLEAVLLLTEAEVDSAYEELRPGIDSRAQLRELADRATSICKAEQRPCPEHLQRALKDLAQLELPLDGKDRSTPRPRVLIIDENADRLLKRRQIFEHDYFETKITTDLADGLALLEQTSFQLVIVDHRASTREEQTILMMLQQFNLQIPVLNMPTFASLIRPDDHSVNRDLIRVAARLFGRHVPDRLPQRRPPTAERGVQRSLRLEAEGHVQEDSSSKMG